MDSDTGRLNSRLAAMFAIDRHKANSLTGEARKKYIEGCINMALDKQLNLSSVGKKQPELEKGRQLLQAETGKKTHIRGQSNFEWIDLKTKYDNLKNIFEEILLQKVREFEGELGALTKNYAQNNHDKTKSPANNNHSPTHASTLTSPFQKLLSTSKSVLASRLQYSTVRPSSRSRDYETLQSSRPLNNKTLDEQEAEIVNKVSNAYSHSEKPYTSLNKHSSSASAAHSSKFCKLGVPLKPNEIKNQKFTNVAIRDTTAFLLKKWTKAEEQQFRMKKSTFRDTFHCTSNVPIIFQFVKKYTTKIKARDHLMSRWEKRDSLKQEQLRYLCATSVFLNGTINSDEKRHIKEQVKSLDRQLLSRLELNIAQKIIETYNQFTGKVAELRKNYYLQLTQESKLHQAATLNQQNAQLVKATRRQQYLSYKKMFVKICASQSLRYKLDSKISRWVKHFVANLKRIVGLRYAEGNKGAKFMSAMSEALISARSKHPASRIIKKEYFGNIKNPEELAYLNSKINESKINKAARAAISFNALKLKNRDAITRAETHKDSINLVNKSVLLRKFISGGPRQISSSLISIDFFTKQISYDKRSLKMVIYIQACWKRAVAVRKFKKVLQNYRDKKEKEFLSLIARLKYIYPPNQRIVYAYVIKRLKKVDKHITAIFNPYLKPEASVHSPPSSNIQQSPSPGNQTSRSRGATLTNRSNLGDSFIQFPSKVSKLSEVPISRPQRRYKSYTYFSHNGQKVSEEELEKRFKRQVRLQTKLDTLFICCKNGLLDRLLKSGFIFTAPELNTLVGGKTALHWTVKCGAMDIAKILLQGGADPNKQQTLHGQSPLHWAFQKGNDLMIILLMDHCADLNKLDYDQNTPLFYGSQELLTGLGLQEGVATVRNGQGRVDNNQLYYGARSTITINSTNRG